VDIEFNNIADLDTNGTGWFIGFSEWTKAKLPGVPNLRYVPQDQRCHTLCMKWMRHPAHDPRGAAKPPSAGRTISILVSESGCFRLEFSEHEDFPDGQIVSYTLQNHGDFAIWREGLHHRWFADEDCTILTLRWIPDQDANP
jgi:hypothetical protein